ncbi:MAG TPA: NAD-dependent epimerase/dehydratase family protein [Caulobacteraceae bacterium]|nr:NAD-dependent epimerase/dehydratase family protein [Caulobacteraceae bacterium]
MTADGPILVTGAAGFIGHAVSRRLLDRGETVIGVDCFNAYYDPALKEARAGTLEMRPGFRMVRLDIAEAEAFSDLLRDSGARRVIHLAAQAGVRYDNPFAYARSNLGGHLAVLEACRHAPAIDHLVYASSSSVYGDRPLGDAFREDDSLAAPVSLYAATKRSAELMSATYAGLYGLPQSGLRFFTVYGPWGRPDMAYFSFTRKILAGEPIEVFGDGHMARDFTYIDDIVDGVIGVLDRPPPRREHRLLNIGGGRPVGLLAMIELLERLLGTPARKIMRPMQPGDVTATFADVSKLQALTGYAPRVTLEEGLPRFVEWYRGFYS